MGILEAVPVDDAEGLLAYLHTIYIYICVGWMCPWVVSVRCPCVLHMCWWMYPLIVLSVWLLRAGEQAGGADGVGRAAGHLGRSGTAEEGQGTGHQVREASRARGGKRREGGWGCVKGGRVGGEGKGKDEEETRGD